MSDRKSSIDDRPRVVTSGPVTARVKTMRAAYRLAYRLLAVGSLVRRGRGKGVKCVLLHRGDVLLVRHTYGRRGLWSLPGGGAHRGETPVQAAAREMGEELGIHGLDWFALGPVALGRRADRYVWAAGNETHREAGLMRWPGPPTHGAGGSKVSCLCAYLDLTDLVLDPVEIAEARWFGIDELPLPRSSEITRVLGLVAAIDNHAAGKDLCDRPRMTTR